MRMHGSSPPPEAATLQVLPETFRNLQSASALPMQQACSCTFCWQPLVLSEQNFS
jgi:hypothetical protein